MVIQMEMEGSEEEARVFITKAVTQYNSRQHSLSQTCLSDFKVETVGEYLDRREVLFIARHHPGNESFKAWLKLYSVRDDKGREEISTGS